TVSSPTQSAAPNLSAPAITLPTSASVLAAIAAQYMNANAANQMANGGYAWISETELSTGEIPAVVADDSSLPIKSSVNAVADMKQMIGNQTSAANLYKGSVVFAPKRDTVVKTQFGDVKVAAKSVVLIMSFTGGTAVYDLDDTHANAVSV